MRGEQHATRPRGEQSPRPNESRDRKPEENHAHAGFHRIAPSTPRDSPRSGCSSLRRPSPAAKGPGHYTRAQAASGAAVYSATCQQCHGVNLQGQSGPGLVGAAFRNYVGKAGTAASLEDFIARQMPADKPGSLTQQQYLDVTAFLLSRNGYPAGDVPLTKSTLADVALGGGGNGATAPKGPKYAANTNEIVRAAAPHEQGLHEAAGRRHRHRVRRDDARARRAIAATGC